MCIRDRIGSHYQQTGSRIAKMQETGYYYAKKMEQDAKSLQALEIEISKLERQIAKKRADLLQKKKTDNENDPYILSGKIKAMKQQIDGLEVNYNDQLAEIEGIKQKVNQARKEKNFYDKIFAQMKVDLEIKKQKSNNIIEVSKNAEVEIKEGKTKLDQFKKEFEQEKIDFQKQVELGIDITENDNSDKKLTELFEQFVAENNQSKQLAASRTINPEFITQPEEKIEAMIMTPSSIKLSLIHISEPTRLGMISYAVFCLKKKKKKTTSTRSMTQNQSM
eukprot:TRINITY_DN12877_c0_g1_i2.p1 TRINITY_DN12877_c0_g1~~TRINITY_DN12877_c0_g1_i2.p1  ORF type:complete len:278 (-),score=75.11 TRINITY_DN12877_c0_g1_i2:14-847(-)